VRPEMSAKQFSTYTNITRSPRKSSFLAHSTFSPLFLHLSLFHLSPYPYCQHTVLTDIPWPATRLGDLNENWFPFVFQLNTQHTLSVLQV